MLTHHVLGSDISSSLEKSPAFEFRILYPYKTQPKLPIMAIFKLHYFIINLAYKNVCVCKDHGSLSSLTKVFFHKLLIYPFASPLKNN